MIKNLINHLILNKIPYTTEGEDRVKIDENIYFVIIPDEDGLLFSEDFILIADEQDCDRYAYCFGGEWYWDNKEDYDRPKMNLLKYIGSEVSDLKTNNFLGVRGAYEILNGSRMYSDWVEKSKFLQCKNLGICEKNTLAGLLKFQLECNKVDIKPVLGATYTIFNEKDDLKYDLKFYVKNEDGWDSLLRINKEVNVINHKFITEDRLMEVICEGLFIIVDPKSLIFEKISKRLKGVIDYFQLDTVEFTNNDKDKEYLENLRKYVKSGFEPIAITDAFYLDKEHSHIKRTLNSISGVHESDSDNQYFKGKSDYYNELDMLFNKEDESFFDLFELSLFNEQTLSDSCNFEVSLGKRFLPKYKMTEEEESKFENNEDLFWNLIETGLRNKIGNVTDIYLNRIETEFAVIEKGDVIDYFLILWDIINYARSQKILVGIGRGSAGGSLIAYCLDIIQLDPIEFDLLFERFLNEGRIVKSLPDIDTDFPGTKRDVIKNYMETRYGKDQVCSVGTYTALQVKASIKDLGKQYNIDYGEINQVTTLLPPIKSMNELFYACKDYGRVKDFVRKNVELINGVRLILHQPKAKSVHACAMLILPAEKDMFQWLPICCLDGQMVSEWEGGELEAAGFLKEDILGIMQLDKFENIISLIKQDKDKEINIYKIPLNDHRVYQYFTKGWNEDTFHFGSRGLTSYCKDLKPDNIEDLIAGISLYRPGAMENNFHNEYVLRKNGDRDVEYYIGSESVLKKTYGVFVYQEQIMKICQVLGGLTLVEADDVRKAMVKKKFQELTKYKERFIPYYVENFGVTQKYSEDVWDVIDKASSYLFNRSHAAAYAITGYISQWFKVNYPIEYWSTAFKFSAEADHANYISEIDKIGDINIMPADINKSRDDVYTDFKNKTIYWPLISIKQLGEKAAGQIIELKDKDGQFFSFEEFCERNKFKGSKVTKQIVENLVMSGAFDEIENIVTFHNRYDLIQYYRKINKIKVDEEKDLFSVNRSKVNEDWWWTLQQKRLSGIAFFDYPELLEKYIEHDAEIISISEFQYEGNAKSHSVVKIGGYITTVEERTSKKGQWCRVRLENNYTFVNVTIWSEQYKQIKELNLIGKEKSLLLISGKVCWDSYKKENILQATDESELLILS